MGQNTVSITEFARKLKEKYPKYAGAADDKLVVAFCQKFPQYQVNYEDGKPVSVGLVASPAAPGAPTAPDSDKAMPVAADTPATSPRPNETSEPSPVPTAPESAASEPAAKAEPNPVAPPTQVEPPAPVRTEMPVAAAPPSPADVARVEPTANTATVAAAPKSTSHSPTLEPKRIPVIVSEPSGRKGPRFGLILFGILILVLLGAFAASQYGLIPWKFLPSAQNGVVPQASGGDGDGVTGEFISGRTTYSDEFVNVESIRVRRSGKGTILAATVYNKSQSKLNSVIINVSCFSGSGTQVVTASFNIRDLLPGERATKDMSGVLTAVPSRVDITRVNHY